MNKIVFFLPAFYSPKCRNSSGGTISNYLMIRQLSNYYKINIVSPDVKVDPILNENISCITTNQYVGISLYNKLKKIKWYSDSIKIISQKISLMWRYIQIQQIYFLTEKNAKKIYF